MSTQLQQCWVVLATNSPAGVAGCIGVATTISLGYELFLKAVHRATLKINNDDDDDERSEDKLFFVISMTMIEFIIFAAEDSTVLLVWWETGTYDTDDKYAVANLYITIATSVICIIAFLCTVALVWWKGTDGQSRWSFVVPCYQARGRTQKLLNAGISFLVFWFPIMLVGAMSFWAYLGIVYIQKGLCSRMPLMLSIAPTEERFWRAGHVSTSSSMACLCATEM